MNWGPEIPHVDRKDLVKAIQFILPADSGLHSGSWLPITGNRCATQNSSPPPSSSLHGDNSWQPLTSPHICPTALYPRSRTTELTFPKCSRPDLRLHSLFTEQ